MTARDIDRFNRHWSPDVDGCHIWAGAQVPGGDGLFRIDGQAWRAHRWLFQFAHGYLPEAVCHACDKRLCVREQCLWPGTRADNNADMRAKGRQATGLRNGSGRIPDEVVTEIRVRYAAGGIGQRALAATFGLSQSHVSSIVRYEKRAS